MTDLEDPVALEQRDTHGMLRLIAGAAAQVRAAAARAAERDLAAALGGGRPRTLICLGAGTGVLAGRLLEVVAGPRLLVPVHRHGGPGLPDWAGALDAVVAVSYSGADADVLAGAEQARRRGARLVAVGAEGSPLQAESPADAFVPVPDLPGLPAAAAERCALWALAVPVLFAGAALGLLALPPDDLEALATRLETVAVACRVVSESFVNPAKEFALGFEGRLPLVWGTSAAAALAARRFAADLAATAKMPALAGSLPEVRRDQVGILDGPFAATPGSPDANVFADPFLDPGPHPTRARLLLFRDPAGETAGTEALAASCVRVAASRGVPVGEVRAEGASPLERFGYLAALGDWTAAYLALLLDLDPAADPAAGALAAPTG